MSDPAPYIIDSFRARLTRIFPTQVRECLAELDDEQIWWRPNETTNAIGNIVVHLTGSLNHFLNRAIGGFEYQRDRAAEFAERRHIPKDELLAMFDDMVAKAEQTLAALTPERLGDPSPEPAMYTVVIEDLLAILSHIANHAGQIIWITKMLKEGAVDEVWINTHKKLGGWKAK